MDPVPDCGALEEAGRRAKGKEKPRVSSIVQYKHDTYLGQAN